MNSRFSNALKGMAMGIAEVIPGVSGGTIAFITGIYELLLDTIKSFRFGLINTFRETGWKGVWREINGEFLLSLVVGMFLGIVVGVTAVTSLLDSYPEILWAFFFGLILASVIYIAKQIKGWGWKEIVALLVGTAIAFGVSTLSPVNGSDNLLYIFFAGMIAICALILPGVSGSFMLVILGLYTTIIPAVKDFLETLSPNLLGMLVVFGLGCLVGLLSFARIVSYAYKNYTHITLALLTGFMLGSLRKIWPWRNPISAMDESGNIHAISSVKDANTHNWKVVEEALVGPGQYHGEPWLFAVVVALVLGFSIVFVLERLNPK